MAEITWRNVNNGSADSPAVQGTAYGVNTIMQSFEPLEAELQKRVDMANHNLDLQSKQNTRDMLAQVQGVSSLGDLNKMVADGRLSETAFNNRYGDQYDPSGLSNAIVNRRQQLQNILLNELNEQAIATADQERDLAAGGAKLRELIRQNGGMVDFAQNASRDFMAGNQDKMALYNKANKADIDSFLGSVGSPTTPEQIESLVEQGRKAGIKDTDSLRAQFTNELNNHYIQEKYRLDKAEHALRVSEHGLRVNEYNEARVARARAQQRQNNLDTASNNAMRYIQEGHTAREAFAKFGNQLGADSLPFLNNLSIAEIGVSSLSAPQKEQLGQVALKGQNQLLNHQAALDAEDASFVAQRNRVTGITPAVLDVVSNAAKDEGGIVGKIVSSTEDTFGPDWFTDLGTDVNTSKANVEKSLNKFREEIPNKVSKISPPEVDAILWLAYQDSRKVAPMGGTGLDPESMRAALEKRLEAFNKGQTIEQDRLQFKRSAEKEMRDLQENFSDYTYSAKKSIEQFNQTGREGDIIQVLKTLNDKTLTIPENGSFGVLNELKLQREKVAKDAAEAAAKKALEDRIKRSSRKTSEYPEKDNRLPGLGVALPIQGFNINPLNQKFPK